MSKARVVSSYLVTLDDGRGLCAAVEVQHENGDFEEMYVPAESMQFDMGDLLEIEE